MKSAHHQDSRVLAISLSTRGFGYTVMEGGAFVDWGVKTPEGDINAGCVKNTYALIKTFTPDVLVTHDPFAKGSKRGDRARQLTTELTTLAQNHSLKVVWFTREQIRRAFSEDGEPTKQDMQNISPDAFLRNSVRGCRPNGVHGRARTTGWESSMLSRSH